MPKQKKQRLGFEFSPYIEEKKTPFETLFEIFKELITHTSGDFDEAMDWLKTLDEKYKITNEDYTLDDFVEDLKKRGYIKDELKPNGKGKK